MPPHIVLDDRALPQADGHQDGQLHGVAEDKAGIAGPTTLLDRHERSHQCGGGPKGLEPHPKPPTSEQDEETQTHAINRDLQAGPEDPLSRTVALL